MAYRLCAFADEADNQLDGQIEALNRNKIDLLEIRGIDGENISELSIDKVKDTHRRLSDAGISVWSIGSPTGKIELTDDFGTHLDEFKRMLDFAHILEAKHFRLFSFFDAQNEIDEVIERLGKFCEAADGSGIMLCHENEKCICGDTAERCLKLLEALPQMKAIFDPANFIQVGVDTLEAWKLLHGKVEYLHIKDAHADGTVVPAGKGDGNLPYIVGEYLKQGGSVMTLEPHLKDFNGLGELENDTTRSKVDTSEFNYPDNQTAFDAAAQALRAILADIG